MRNNKYKNVEIKSFYDVDDLMELIGNELAFLTKKENLVVYAKRDLIAESFVELIKLDFDFRYIDLDKIDDILEDEVYIMTITKNCEIAIEKAYRNGKIVMNNSKTALIYTDDCKQDIVDYCVDENMRTILFDFENDKGYDEECEKCCNRKYCDYCEYEEDLYEDENEDIDKEEGNITDVKSNSSYVGVFRENNGSPSGFTKSWTTGNDNTMSSYTYTFHCDDLDVLKKTAKVFDINIK